MEIDSVKVGERYVDFDDIYSEMWIKEIIAIAPTLESDGGQVVFCKVTTIPRNTSNDDEFVEDTTKPRTVEYSSYYDWVLTIFGEKFEGDTINGIKVD